MKKQNILSLTCSNKSTYIHDCFEIVGENAVSLMIFFVQLSDTKYLINSNSRNYLSVQVVNNLYRNIKIGTKLLHCTAYTWLETTSLYGSYQCNMYEQ
jgi:hypothetical protein